MVIKIDSEIEQSLFNTPIIFGATKVQGDGFVMVVQPLSDKEKKIVEESLKVIEMVSSNQNDDDPPVFALDLSLLDKIAAELGTEKLAFWLGEKSSDPILVRPYHAFLRRNPERKGYGIIMPLRNRLAEKE